MVDLIMILQILPHIESIVLEVIGIILHQSLMGKLYVLASWNNGHKMAHALAHLIVVPFNCC